jgi:hypothetical protein
MAPWEPHEEAPGKPTPPPPPPPPPPHPPHRGLYEAISGEQLPSFGELRERYGDPADLKPIPVPGGASTVTGPLAQSPRVDFREMLRDSPGAIMKRERIAAVIGRPYLATQLVELLPVEVSARLADRLQSLKSQIIAETIAEISAEVTRETITAIQRLDAEAAAKLEEVRRERFTHRSRLA